MSDPAATGGAGDKEPATSIGQKFAQFYRAHRTEVIGGAGVLVAGFAYYRSKHPSSASAATNATDTSTTASGIDPATGVPYATELAEAQQASSTGDGTVYPSGSDGSTGYSGSGYGGDGGEGSSILTALQAIQTQLQTGISVTSDPPPSTTVTPSQTSNSPTATQAANLKNLNNELAKDEKISTPAAKASVSRLNTQIAAVKARS
jgi:hypothetical protein